MNARHFVFSQMDNIEATAQDSASAHGTRIERRNDRKILGRYTEAVVPAPEVPVDELSFDMGRRILNLTVLNYSVDRLGDDAPRSVNEDAAYPKAAAGG
jgi:hypothetical protein